MSETIPDAAHKLLDEPNYAHVVTLMADGMPQPTPVWIGRDGDIAVFNTAKGRTKHINLVRDNRIAMSVTDAGDPYVYLQIRGRAEFVDQGAIDHINAMAQKYLGRDYPWLQEGEERVIVRIVPEAVHFDGPK